MLKKENMEKKKTEETRWTDQELQAGVLHSYTLSK